MDLIIQNARIKETLDGNLKKCTDVVLIDTSEDDEKQQHRSRGIIRREAHKGSMTDENPYYVYDTDLSDYRRIQYGDIAILTRTLTGWARYIC